MRASIPTGLCLLVIGAFLASVTVGCSTIYSGNKIGMKYLHVGNSWLGCWHGVCNRATCPGMYFQAEKAHCYGEIFRIYKRQGNGAIRIGDQVGLYYIHTNQWLSCWGNRCDRRSCPGSPSSTHGMNTAYNHCKGEIFIVYALGKKVGEYLEDKDTIMLNYPWGWNQWLGLNFDGEKKAAKATCPGAAYPPPSSKYEPCWGEGFEIRRLNFVSIGK